MSDPQIDTLVSNYTTIPPKESLVTAPYSSDPDSYVSLPPKPSEPVSEPTLASSNEWLGLTPNSTIEQDEGLDRSPHQPYFWGLPDIDNPSPAQLTTDVNLDLIWGQERSPEVKESNQAASPSDWSPSDDQMFLQVLSEFNRTDNWMPAPLATLTPMSAAAPMPVTLPASSTPLSVEVESDYAPIPPELAAVLVAGLTKPASGPPVLIVEQQGRPPSQALQQQATPPSQLFTVQQQATPPLQAPQTSAPPVPEQQATRPSSSQVSDQQATPPNQPPLQQAMPPLVIQQGTRPEQFGAPASPDANSPAPRGYAAIPRFTKTPILPKQHRKSTDSPYITLPPASTPAAPQSILLASPPSPSNHYITLPKHNRLSLPAEALRSEGAVKTKTRVAEDGVLMKAPSRIVPNQTQQAQGAPASPLASPPSPTQSKPAASASKPPPMRVEFEGGTTLLPVTEGLTVLDVTTKLCRKRGLDISRASLLQQDQPQEPSALITSLPQRPFKLYMKPEVLLKEHERLAAAAEAKKAEASKKSEPMEASSSPPTGRPSVQANGRPSVAAVPEPRELKRSLTFMLANLDVLPVTKQCRSCNAALSDHSLTICPSCSTKERLHAELDGRLLESIGQMKVRVLDVARGLNAGTLAMTTLFQLDLQRLGTISIPEPAKPALGNDRLENLRSTLGYLARLVTARLAALSDARPTLLIETKQVLIDVLEAASFMLLGVGVSQEEAAGDF